MARTSGPRDLPLTPPTGPWLPEVDGRDLLLATSDGGVRAETLRLAAGAGCAVSVSSDPGAVRGAWASGRPLLIGGDLLAPVAAMRLPRRAGVHVVTWGSLDAGQLRAAVTVGVAVVVELPGAAEQLAGLLGDLADSDRPAGLVVGVVGGSGGVGASVLTVALAGVAARSGPAVAVDLAPGGAGLEMVAGHDARGGLDWGALGAARGRLNAPALRESLQAGAGLPLLGWAGDRERSMPPDDVVAETLAAARRGHDVVAVDAPTAHAWPHCDVLVLVVATSVHGAVAAGRVASRLPAGTPCGVAARCRRGASWPLEVSRALSLPLWGAVPDQRGLDEHLSAGLGPVARSRSPVARAAAGLLRAAESAR